MKKYIYTDGVDYFKQVHKRKKLARYLKAGSCRKIAGKPSFEDLTLLRRRSLVILAVIVFLIGVYYVMF